MVWPAIWPSCARHPACPPSIDAQRIPLSEPARGLLARGVVGVESIVAGGDDYEILCAVPQNRLEAFTQAAGRAGVTVTAIGSIVAGEAVPRFLDPQGVGIALQRLSYSHF